MEKVRVGIIGAGRIGRVHSKSLTNNVPEAELVAISDKFVESAKKAAEEFGIPNYYEDYHKILEDPTIQAVFVCSPTNTHADIAMEAAKAGKHIFCEKPIDTSVAKILETEKVVKEAGVKMQIGFNRRFDHNFRKIHELAKNGDLGKIQIVKITSRDPEPPSAEYAAASGGMFLDMTIHDFDMACFLTNSDVEEIYVNSAVLVDPAIGEQGDVDTAIITMKMSNGALAVIDNSRRAAYGYDQRAELFGSKGMVATANDTLSTAVIADENGVTGEKPLFFFLERYMESFSEEMRQFVNACENDTEVPVGIHAGMQSVKIGLAAKKSVAEHRPVLLSEI